MKACNLSSNLYYPMLPRDFVNRLPTHQKLNWALHPAVTSSLVVQISKISIERHSRTELKDHQR